MIQTCAVKTTSAKPFFKNTYCIYPEVHQPTILMTIFVQARPLRRWQPPCHVSPPACGVAAAERGPQRTQNPPHRPK